MSSDSSSGANIYEYIKTITNSPGKVYGEFTKEMLKSHEELKDFKKYMKKNLNTLKDNNIVSDDETNQIIRIIDTITSTKEFNEKAEEVIKIYNQILEDKNSGAIARVISCIAADSAQNKYERPKTPFSSKSEHVLGVNVSGSLIGAIIGSNGGGTKGAILGALIGGCSASLTT
jgi:hypothetical protein